MQRTFSGHSLKSWGLLAYSGPRPARQQNSMATHATDAPCSSRPIDFVSQVLPKVRLGMPQWCAMKLWSSAQMGVPPALHGTSSMQMAVLPTDTCQTGPVADAGQPFAVTGGQNGKQGMLLAVFRDMLAGCDVIAATTHLKAKAGQVRWLTHQAWPGIAPLRYGCTEA